MPLTELNILLLTYGSSQLKQMADNAILASEMRTSLGVKFENLYNFFEERKQSINIDKTLYIHMSKSPDTEMISCNNDRVSVSSLEVGKSAPYLGLYSHEQSPRNH